MRPLVSFMRLFDASSRTSVRSRATLHENPNDPKESRCSIGYANVLATELRVPVETVVPKCEEQVSESSGAPLAITRGRRLGERRRVSLQLASGASSSTSDVVAKLLRKVLDFANGVAGGEPSLIPHEELPEEGTDLTPVTVPGIINQRLDGSRQLVERLPGLVPTFEVVRVTDHRLDELAIHVALPKGASNTGDKLRGSPADRDGSRAPSASSPCSTALLLPRIVRGVYKHHLVRTGATQFEDHFIF